MKKMILLGILTLGINSLGRDYDFNERRDIIIPIIENTERMSRFTPEEMDIEAAAAEENIDRYQDFHEALDRAHMSEKLDR